MANQVRARDMHFSCVLSHMHVPKLSATVLAYMPVFEVLHALNVQAHACTCTRVLSCTVTKLPDDIIKLAVIV